MPPVTLCREVRERSAGLQLPAGGGAALAAVVEPEELRIGRALSIECILLFKNYINQGEFENEMQKMSTVFFAARIEGSYGPPQAQGPQTAV